MQYCTLSTFFFSRLFRKIGNQGSVAVEYAILLPAFIVLSLAVIEFGMYFVKSEITSSAVSSLAQAIQRDPSLTNAQLQTLAKSYGSGLVKFQTGGNYICGRAYASAAVAQAATPCADTNFNVSDPTGTGAYYIVISAALAKSSVTPLGNFVKGAKNIQITQSSGVVQIGSIVPKDCTKNGYFLQYDHTKNPPWQCVPFTQTGSGSTATDCSEPWQKLTYNSKTGLFSCQNIPYVFAGGIAWPNTKASSSHWDGTGGIAPDWAAAPWISSGYPTTLPYATICTHITFTVPADLPAGQIVAQGNLIYPGAGNDGNWHDWAVSFVHLDTGPPPPTSSAYSGSADMCMASGGNYGPYTERLVYSEHASWTIIFIPN
ncbi:MAG TPA: TadE/TadG family type IV pilus assembly protein [Rickettsiales bacterium]|nr:TadE/TadG family type IV pilus assembly protein [Rickettsiales bacterium]